MRTKRRRVRFATVLSHRRPLTQWARLPHVIADAANSMEDSSVAGEHHTRYSMDANVSARELYDHADDVGDAASGEAGDWDNLADAPEYAETVAALHAQLVAIIEAAAIDPLI